MQITYIFQNKLFQLNEQNFCTSSILTKMSTPVKVCHYFWRFTTVDFFFIKLKVKSIKMTQFNQVNIQVCIDNMMYNKFVLKHIAGEVCI